MNDETKSKTKYEEDLQELIDIEEGLFEEYQQSDLDEETELAEDQDENDDEGYLAEEMEVMDELIEEAKKKE